LAIKLDCTYSLDIPPGNVKGGPNGGEYPDYYLYSGLCRDVWLVCADNVSIPLYGQKITTPTATSASATVRIRTTVNNASTAAASCVVQSVVVNASDAIVSQASASGSVAANGSTVFDCTTPAISNPSLWSPETPNLYRVFTKVIVNNVAIDDNVERIGIRNLDWKAIGGFFLNGARYLLKGVGHAPGIRLGGRGPSQQPLLRGSTISQEYGRQTPYAAPTTRAIPLFMTRATNSACSASPNCRRGAGRFTVSRYFSGPEWTHARKRWSR